MNNPFLSMYQKITGQEKFPMFSPNEYNDIILLFQNTLWENHPYHLSMLWKNSNSMFNALYSYNQNDKFYYQKSKEIKKLKYLNGNNLILKSQMRIYFDISFQKIIDDLIIKSKNLKDSSKHTKQLATESKDYLWLEATVNVLKNAISKQMKNDKSDEEALLQFEVHYLNTNSSKLKIRIHSLRFELDFQQDLWKMQVIDTKNNPTEVANLYSLNFFDLTPKVIDLLNSVFKLLMQTNQRI